MDSTNKANDLEKYKLTWREIYASALVAIDRKTNDNYDIRKIKEIAEYSDKL